MSTYTVRASSWASLFDCAMRFEAHNLLGMRLRELDALLAEAEAADIVARVEPADEPDMRKVVVYTGEDAVARVGVLAKKQDKLVPSLDDEETEQLLADKAYLESIYKEGAERASYLANKTLRKVYKKVGFVAK